MRVTKRLMAALLACLMLLSLLPVPAYAADDGRIALLAVTQDGYVIEPEYIGYRSGDTVKDVLKNSGHTFSGIDSGFITAVDGRTDNYSLHYDGDGYALDASAKGLTAIWFTTNANQSYGDDLLHLAERMAAYNTSTNGLKDYAAAKEAYDAAHSGFYAAANAAAAPLRTALEKAIDKFEAFQAGDRVTVTIAATQDGNAVTTSGAPWRSPPRAQPSPPPCPPASGSRSSAWALTTSGRTARTSPSLTRPTAAPPSGCLTIPMAPCIPTWSPETALAPVRGR